MEQMRLNKYLSDAGVCSRREADRLTEEGLVTVNGKRAALGMKIEPGAEVCIRGKRITRQEEKVLLAFHKPAGIVCTAEKREKNNVIDFLNYPIRIFPVGRLDKDSTGLLLMTNDGELVNKIMRAGNYHEKEYLVKVNRPIDEAFCRKMAAGVPILDTVTRPCKVEKLDERAFRIILTQGLNRQIRRMCEALGYRVTELKRVRIMNILLGNLKEGTYRKIQGKEKQELERLLQSSTSLSVKERQRKMAGRKRMETGNKAGKIERMKELAELLQRASKAYYQEDREIMSNREYDELYDELVRLEEESGTVLTGSPTVTVGYEAVDELPKEAHESPMLSLDKTKEREALRSFIGDRKTLLSWKMDGLTIVLTYREGELYKAVTRGNGVIGEVVTNNARVFDNIPLKIPYKGELILRGEAIITYSEFEKINRQIEDVDAKYKNPRNLCSGSVRQLNNQITANRHVRFYAFALVRAEQVDFENSNQKKMEWLRNQGFEVTEYRVVTGETLDEAMEYFADKVKENDFPSDGLVALYDDIAYGESLGRTAKFPRNAYAFKWADEMADTTLEAIEWSPSRTGLINPVAIFTPVELEGTTVSRASVHNISIMRKLELGIGDKIRVYKANMIIPQIEENLTRSGVKDIPACCPACGGATKIEMVNDVESLYCRNQDCPAKAIKGFTLFVSRDAMNIDGLSEATLEKFIGKGFIHNLGDIFEIGKYKDEIVTMEGFGEKSFQNLMESLEKAKKTELPRVIYALGIPNIGLANAKMICKEFAYDMEKIRHLTEEELARVDGIGPVIAKSFVDYFAKEGRQEKIDHLLSHLELPEPPKTEAEQDMQGLTFVITGSVEHFANRNEVKAEIEKRGGKVTGSVTSKTSYLINNDTTSNSSKNKKARELGIPVLSEETFMEMWKIER